MGMIAPTRKRARSEDEDEDDEGAREVSAISSYHIPRLLRLSFSLIHRHLRCEERGTTTTIDSRSKHVCRMGLSPAVLYICMVVFRFGGPTCRYLDR
jgi:hypothetical protein